MSINQTKLTKEVLESLNKEFKNITIVAKKIAESIAKNAPEYIEEIKKPVQDPNVLHLTVEPRIGEKYSWLNGKGGVYSIQWGSNEEDLYRFESHNCYTEKNAKIALSILKAKIELQNIATELNDGRLIDWEDESQRRYNIYFLNDDLGFEFLNSKNYRSSNIYCLDDSFLKVAIKKMGVDNLKLALEIWK